MTDFETMIESAVEEMILSTPTTFDFGGTDYLGVREYSPASSLQMMDAGDANALEFRIKTTVTRLGAATITEEDTVTVDPDGDAIACRVVSVETTPSHITLRLRKKV